MPVNRPWNPPQEHVWVDPGNFGEGPCRKRAPIGIAASSWADSERRKQWPQTTQEDWCGDWEPRVGDDPTTPPKPDRSD